MLFMGQVVEFKIFLLFQKAETRCRFGFANNYSNKICLPLLLNELKFTNYTSGAPWSSIRLSDSGS